MGGGRVHTLTTARLEADRTTARAKGSNSFPLLYPLEGTARAVSSSAPLSSQNSSVCMPVAWSRGQDDRTVAFTPVAESHLADDGGLQVAGRGQGLYEVCGCPGGDHSEEASSSLWGPKVHNKVWKLGT